MSITASINNNGYTSGSATRLNPQRTMLYAPETEWLYSHHPHITHFRGELLAIWSNGRGDEDAPGQRVLIARSADGTHWGAPVPLLDSRRGRHSELVFTAAGFHQHDGQLVVYIGVYEYRPEALENGERKPDDKGHMNTTLLAMTTQDGQTWSDPVDLQIPIVPNHGPQATRSGRLIISGNTAHPYTDDPTGLHGWTMSGVYPETMQDTIVDDSETFTRIQAAQGWPVPVCEGSFFEPDDGVLHMLLRTNTEHLWGSESRDNGTTWSSPAPTVFTDNGTKFHFGRLPDGRFYYVGNPDPDARGERPRLVLSLSANGTDFDRHYLLADSSYTLRAQGLHKGGEYGYPHSMVHDGRLYAIVSRKKEAVELLRIDLADLA